MDRWHVVVAVLTSLGTIMIALIIAAWRIAQLRERVAVARFLAQRGDTGASILVASGIHRLDIPRDTSHLDYGA